MILPGEFMLGTIMRRLTVVVTNYVRFATVMMKAKHGAIPLSPSPAKEKRVVQTGGRWAAIARTICGESYEAAARITLRE